MPSSLSASHYIQHNRIGTLVALPCVRIAFRIGFNRHSTPDRSRPSRGEAYRHFAFATTHQQTRRKVARFGEITAGCNAEKNAAFEVIAS